MEGNSKGDLSVKRGLHTGLGMGLVVKLRSGLVQVRLQLKFNSLELDSEVGRVVEITFA